MGGLGLVVEQLLRRAERLTEGGVPGLLAASKKAATSALEAAASTRHWVARTSRAPA